MRSFTVIALAVLAVAQTAAQQPSQPVFRAGVDVLTVEASVLDGKGQPIADLTAQDFSVTIDGKPRRVREARFHHDEGDDVVTSAAVPTVPGPAINSTGGGRIVVFVVDRDSIATGNEKVVLEAAGTVLEGLGPADAAGVLELPGTATDLTRDHARVRAALMRLTGSRPPTMMSRDYNISWDEALGYERRDAMTIARVVERECRDFRQAANLRNPCPPELRAHANQLLLTGRFRTQSVMASLSALAKQLAPMRGAKQVVLLTSGFPFGQDLLPLFNQFAAQAAESQIVFYAVQLQEVGADVTQRKPVTSGFGGNEFASGVGNLASMSGGATFMASGSGSGIFKRVRTEMNNFYELGIELESADAAAEALDIEVKVARPGASVRNRRRVTPRARAAASADPLSDLIRQPVDVPEIPLAISAYTMRGDEPSMLRTIVGLEAGSAANHGPAEWGFAVYNEGNVVATGRQRLDRVDGPWTAAISAKLMPGRYRLRVSVLDGAGRAGVLERPLEVGLRGNASVQFSDLLIGVADDNGRLQPLSRVKQGASLSALVEVVSADPAALEQVRTVIEIVPGGTAVPIKKFVMGARSGTSAAILTNQAAIATTDLLPGRYTAIATVSIGEQPIGKVSRLFEIVRP
jgi:VWFA-related protein